MSQSEDAVVTRRFILDAPRPYFAEFPYLLWGHANYDSEGDCERPTDQKWSELQVRNRENGEQFIITRDSPSWIIEAPAALADQISLFLVHRCGATAEDRPAPPEWDMNKAFERAALVAKEFSNPLLQPFDNHSFWGGWKWISWYATDFTWVGRWIMHSVVRNDPRAIPLCVEWLKDAALPEQEPALCIALRHLSGEPAKTPQEWIEWYEQASTRYPDPDLTAWLDQLRSEDEVDL